MTKRLLGLLPLLLASTACTFVGRGEGEVTSDALVVPECWFGTYDLDPDFFASNPVRNQQQLRIQRGGDLQELSDGVSVLVNDTEGVRSSMLGVPLDVGLPPQLLSEISPGIIPPGEPPPVNLALYLQFSCRNQNVVLYAVDGTITFQSLFSGDPNETQGAEKLTDANFDVTIADPRDVTPGTLDIPAEKTSRLIGFFRFNFQRGQPGQPFP